MWCVLLQRDQHSLQCLLAPELEHQLQFALLSVLIHPPCPVQLLTLGLSQVPLQPSSKALALPVQGSAGSSTLMHSSATTGQSCHCGSCSGLHQVVVWPLRCLSTPTAMLLACKHLCDQIKLMQTTGDHQEPSLHRPGCLVKLFAAPPCACKAAAGCEGSLC